MIEILLPVYNGEKYLAEQIDSIIDQTYTDWILKIRNDGSSDASQTIIDSYCNTYPSKIICYKGIDANVGLLQSLNLLMKTSDADYVMFSDQDDIWLENKIEVTLQEMKRIENVHGFLPAMVCTDVICVDANCNVIAESFFESQKFIHGVVGDKVKMLALNEVQGCTIMVNRYAMEYISPFPDCMKIHDMWIGVVVAHYGHVSYLYKQTMLYRQHGNNTAGQVKVNNKYYLQRSKRLVRTIRFLSVFIDHLPFKPNILLILYYKLFFYIKRIKKK